MSVPVDAGELAGHVVRYGPVAFLVTVGDGSRPHVVSVAVALDGELLRAPAGRTTVTNAAARPAATLVWPDTVDSGYCLIVDGRVTVRDGGDGAEIALEPTRAVLHRVAGHTEGPSCITVVDRRPGRARP